MIETVTPTASHYTRLATMFFWRYLVLSAILMVLLFAFDSAFGTDTGSTILLILKVMLSRQVVGTMVHRKVKDATLLGCEEGNVITKDVLNSLPRKVRAALEMREYKICGRFIWPYAFWNVVYFAFMLTVMMTLINRGVVGDENVAFVSGLEFIFSTIFLGWVVPYVIFVRLINNPKKGRMLALVKTS